MKKQNYSKPFMVAEKFIPQEYCWVCYPSGANGVYAPFKETNGLVGLQINGTSQGWHGTTQNYPGDQRESNIDGWMFIRCSVPVYKIYPAGESAVPSDDDHTSPAWEGYYTHGDNTGQGVYVFHQIEQDGGNTFYKINTQVDFKSIETNHS